MKKLFNKLVLFGVFVFACLLLKAQRIYTPYDELPGIIKLEKPGFDENYPEWAKKLYQYPVNFYEVCEGFEQYLLTHGTEKNAVIRYFKNWKTAVEPYALDNGEIQLPDIETLMGKNREALLNVGRLEKSVAINNSDWTFWGPKETIWRNTGDNQLKAGKPAPWQANVYSFDVAASNNDILYCGTETGFVNKTINNGLNWNICAPDYHFSGGVTAIAIHPAKPDIVYASAGGQIHKTSDGGQNWVPMLNAGNTFSATRLRIDSNNHDKIIAASDKGIYISTNAGETWSLEWNTQTWDIEIKPDDSNVIYGISSSKGNQFELVISSDGGTSFSKNTAFPSNIINQSGGLIAVTPANPDVVYVSLLVKETDDDYAHIYKGTHSNGNWTWVRTKRGEPRSVAGLGGFSTGQGYFDFVMEASPDDENVVFWGTCSLFKSTDGAVNFIKIGGYGGDFSIHPDIQDIKLLPNGRMWVSTDGGMNYSTDYFTSDENYRPSVLGIVGSHMWGFDQGWNQDIIVGGRYHNGNTAITDFYEEKSLRMGGAEAPTGWIVHGRNNQAAFSDINKGFTTSIPATKDEVVANKKYSFSKLPNMKSYGGRRGNLLHHPNYHSVLYVGEGKGFWKSSDMGATFDLLHQFGNDVMFIQNSFKNPNVIYADVEGEGLYKSEDEGQTWTQKPALINEHGVSGWAGYLHFVVSPYDENRLYAIPQKKSAWWNAKVLKSEDGGNSWINWSASLPQTEYTKCLSIQPTNSGDDLVYLIVSAQKNQADAIGKVFYRKEGMSDWEEYDNNYPAGMAIIYAKPFYRDSKIRVAGKGGIWESPLAEPDFTPMINPWVDFPVSKCALDTLYLDDHSILNHEGVSWKWTVDPAPQYISNVNVRNPKIVPGTPGTYSVSLEVTKNGQTYVKTMDDMFSCTTCPSVEDCSNPGKLDKSKWSLIYVDSQEHDRLGTMAFDDDTETFWHTEWRNSKPVHPHEIQIDLGERYNMHELAIVNRSNGSNGRMKDYKIYFTDNKNNWGNPVKTGKFEDVVSPPPIKFNTPPMGRYLKVVGVSEVNNKEFTTIAEITIRGCYASPVGVEIIEAMKEIKAFPVPTNGLVNLSLPVRGEFRYCIYSNTGQLMQKGTTENSEPNCKFDLRAFRAGVYYIKLTDASGIAYRAKIIKQ